MLKKILFALIFPSIVLILSSAAPKPAWEQENVSFPMMNQEIRHSMEENGRQKEMKKKQFLNLSLEKLNTKEWTKFKETSAKIQERLRFVDFTMQAIPTGYAITLETQRIAATQEKIYNELRLFPAALYYAIPNQLAFVQDMQMVVRLLIGIVASYGAINQMEKAERKILLDYALEEVQQLRKDSHFMLVKVREIRRKFEWNRFLIKNYVNNDKKIIKEIMSNF